MMAREDRWHGECKVIDMSPVLKSRILSIIALLNILGISASALANPQIATLPGARANMSVLPPRSVQSDSLRLRRSAVSTMPSTMLASRAGSQGLPTWLKAIGFPSGSAYVASKHGLIGLTTSVSAELAPRGVRVNVVCPGIVDTPMHQRARKLLGDELYDTAVIPSVHLRRAGRPEEIARAVVFLCSDDASYITGATLTPDVGFTLTV